MIVKVQLPKSTTEEEPRALIYDESRTWQMFAPLSQDLVAAMRGRDKAFFYAELTRERLGHGDGIIIDEEAPWQEW